MAAPSAPPGSGPGEAPRQVVDVWRALVANMVDSLTVVAVSFQALGAKLVAGVEPLLRLAVEMEWANELAVAIYAEDFVVDRMGISRVDIRHIGMAEVRLWNHRRIPFDRDACLDYALARSARGGRR